MIPMELTLEYDDIEYPPIIEDIIQRIVEQEYVFSKITIWYGDGHDYDIYYEVAETVSFKKGFILIKTRTGSLLYIPYNEIYEILITQ